MERSRILVALLAVFFLVAFAPAQQPAGSGAVPKLINYSGVLKDSNGKVLTSIAGVTFLIYGEEQGGAPLWMETQNVQPDSRGNYSVQLGATKPEGMPVELFTSGEARWLALTVNGGQELPRVLLVTVPYAMKAVDAQTLGGLPASAFVLAAPATAAGMTSSAGAATDATTAPGTAPTTFNVTTTGGTVNTIPLFSTSTNIQNSILTQTGITSVSVGGALNLPATGVATKTAGNNSRPETMVASSFSSSTSKAVNQTFQLQAEPANNNTTAPSGTLNLLFGSGTSIPTETGLKISSKGIFTFATGQTFPGTGNGTITGVTAGSDLTGGGTSGSVTLNLDTTKVPQLAALNTFSGNNTFSVTGTDAIDAYTTGPGKSAVVALNNATGGGAIGLFAWTLDGLGQAVVGINKATPGGVGVWGQGFPGVYGLIPGLTEGGAGVQGQVISLSSVGQVDMLRTAGVWGDGGPDATTAGVVGTADEGFAGIFINNSSNAAPTLAASSANSAAMPFIAENDASGGFCNVDTKGNLNCSGSKNAVVPVDSGKRIIAMSAIESPVNWFEDAGSGRIVNGTAVIGLDSTFIQTVNTAIEYQVFLTPYGDCKGLYVTNRTANSFEVHELGGGTSSLSFGYRIMAVRKNYETVRFADHTHDLDGVKRMRERMKAGVRHVPLLPPKSLAAFVPASSRSDNK